MSESDSLSTILRLFVPRLLLLGDALCSVKMFGSRMRRPIMKLLRGSKPALRDCRKQAKQGVALLQGAANSSEIGKKSA